MANFCTNCGAPSAGRFCNVCGTQAKADANPAPAPASPAPAAVAGGSGSAVKVIVIVLAGVVFLGVLGLCGAVYVGYRAKQKIAQIKRDYGFTADSSSSALPANFPPPRGSGCPMLSGQDASRILGVAIDRVEFKPDGADGVEECRFWVSAAERQRLIKSEIGSGIGALGKTDDLAAFEKVIGGAMGAVIETAGDNKDQDYAMLLQVYRSRGQAMWDKLEAGKGSVQAVTGIDLGTLGVQPVEGVGDKATIIPGGHSIMTLKGDKLFYLGFQQFVPGRDKATALAKLVADRL